MFTSPYLNLTSLYVSKSAHFLILQHGAKRASFKFY